jgi:hypothetical protein
LQEVPPYPLKKSRTKGCGKQIVSLRIDSRREDKPRSCYRKRLGATNPTRSESCFAVKFIILQLRYNILYYREKYDRMKKMQAV